MKFTKLKGSLIFILLLTMTFLSTSVTKSAYLENIETKITQPNGSVIECFVTGDEFFRRLHDNDGFTIIKHPVTRYYVYAVRSGDTLMPSNYVVGEADPKALGLKPGAVPAPFILEMKRSEHYRHVPKPDVKKKEGTLVSNIGTIQNIVIYIRFADDTEFTRDTSTFWTMFNNASGNSMLNYFREVSYNQLSIYTSFYPRPSSNIVKSYQDSHIRNYFRPYDANDNPDGYQNDTQKRDREHILLRDAVLATRSEIPAGLAIDNDADGYVDNVCFIIKGNNDGWSDLLWPHRWSLYSQNVTINSKRVWDYNFQLENFLVSSGNGVLSHEMFHTLGAPDLYHYNQDGLDPVWRWDIMASTTNPPQHMGAWMKKTYGGWISNIPEITTNGNYTLNPLTSSTNNAYKIASPNSSTEFFVVEYRNKTGTFENSLQGSGLLVYRIKPALEGNASGPPDEVYIYRPNGTTTVRGNPENAHFSSTVGRTEINNTTNPSSFLSDGSAGGLNISAIGSPGGTISFTYGSGGGLTPPTLVFPGDMAYGVPLSAVLRWNRVTGATSYDVQVSRNSGFTDLAYNQTGITDSTVTVSPALSYNQTYWWKVRAVSGQASDWSTVRSFTTEIPAPTLATPANNAINFGLTDTLRWNSVAEANNYSLEISLQSNFSSTILQMSAIGNTYYVVPQGILQNNKVNYWRVRAIKSSPYNESGWSEIRSFTTLLATPVLSTPKKDSLGFGLSGLLTWTSVSGATAYNVKLSDDPTYSTTVLNQTGITGNSLAVSGLAYNKKYYWTVQATAGSQVSLWADNFNFTTKLGIASLVAPENNAVNVDLNAQLRWNKVPGATSYMVQVASDTNMSALVVDNGNIADSNLTMSGLSSISKYTWRVKAKSTDGRTGDWSEKWNFTTKLGPPTIPSPPDNGTNIPVEGMLVWNNINGATKYHAKLSKNQDLSNPIVNDTTLVSTSVQYPVLEANQTYYWAVRSLAGQSSSDWSTVWKFQTGLGRVQLSLPEKGSRGNPLNGTISWLAMSGATGYDVMLASDVSFSSPIINQTNVNTTSLIYNNLQKNTAYFWKVRANKGTETGQWSQVWDFVTTAGEPSLVSPPNNKGGLGLSGTLNWRSVASATNYELQISEYPNMSTPFFTRTNPDTFYTYSNYEHYRDYYWRVRASTPDGFTNWSETRKFTTLITNPDLDYPENQKKNSQVSGTLAWYPVSGATGYTLWVSDRQNFSNLLVEENLNSTSYDYNDFKYYTKYFWKVKALNPDANSDWSETREFLTVLDKPLLEYPPNDTNQIPFTVRLTWHHVDGYQTYNIKVAKDANFANMIANESGLEFAFFDLTNLEGKTRYYWKVNATNQYSTGEWSEVRSFVSKDPTDIDEYGLNGLSLEIYPNPFSDVVSFKINGADDNSVKFEIYNSAGMKVTEISGESNQYGTIFNWNAVNYPQGIYNVVLKAGLMTKTQQIILMR
ncbi:M6 family metalloprotease domain-containing protein [Bacteroidetes/Chlorobi group bacterium ChocPot_Mid]|nr:MAG: M6 family metalloprotease domain-containing protein [Bacteroidetes/Chlorobi group bacterium ChocPot_Mid]